MRIISFMLLLTVFAGCKKWDVSGDPVFFTSNPVPLWARADTTEVMANRYFAIVNGRELPDGETDFPFGRQEEGQPNDTLVGDWIKVVRSERPDGSCRLRIMTVKNSGVERMYRVTVHNADYFSSLDIVQRGAKK